MTTPTIPDLPSLTGELNIPSFTAATPATVEKPATPAGDKPTEPITVAAAKAPVLSEAMEAMSVVEMNNFIDTLEGDDEVNTTTLQTIAKKLLAGPLKEAYRAKHKTAAMEQVVANLVSEIETLRAGQKQTAEQITASQDTQARDMRFGQLKSACKDIQIDMEAALIDPKVVEVLNNQTKDEDSALVLSQEISQFMLRGEYVRAAKLMKVAIDKATPPDPASTKGVAPAAAGGTPVVPEVKSYEQELSEITAAYSRSNKTFADAQTRVSRIDALKKKHGRA